MPPLLTAIRSITSYLPTLKKPSGVLSTFVAVDNNNKPVSLSNEHELHFHA